jgi:hypothetical protein
MRIDALVQRGPAAVAVALLCACGADNTASNVAAPGRDETPKTAALEAGAALLQDHPPVDAIEAYLDGFHFYSGDLDEQMEAHHYCGHVNEEVIQCVIFDGNTRDAKLMGVEYIVSRRLFETLPANERKLWHSHVHEVKSGALVAPGIPGAAERELMEKLVDTYGKTFHTWHTDRGHALPTGVPQLMMGFTQDGQLQPSLLQARDERFGLDTARKREERADLPTPAVAPGADAWQRGTAIQIADPTR